MLITILLMTLADVGIGGTTAATIGNSVIKYYTIPFTSGGITLRMDVSGGYVDCYISDTVRHPGPYNYPYLDVLEWRLHTGDYEDIFIDPAQFSRSRAHYIYVAVRGGYNYYNRNSYLMTSASGNFMSQGMECLCILSCRSKFMNFQKLDLEDLSLARLTVVISDITPFHLRVVQSLLMYKCFMVKCGVTLQTPLIIQIVKTTCGDSSSLSTMIHT